MNWSPRAAVLQVFYAVWVPSPPIDLTALPMRIIFVDALGWDYDVASPLQRPLGGSQSALCYLAQALARLGHEVALVTGIAYPRAVLGVQCYPLAGIPTALFAAADVVIALNGPAEVSAQLRPYLGPQTVLVFWNQHAVDQPALAALRRPEIAQSWDQIVCVSDWHRATMLQSFALRPDRVQVHRNALTPCFEHLFATPDAVADAKSHRCILAYTSTPFRGLDALLDVFPGIHHEFPETEVHVYSSMVVYQVTEARDRYRHLYERCRATTGVRYWGSVPQPQLAEALRSAAILSYPNTFAETSCIAVTEALAAGLYVVSSHYGALPETTLGFGELVPFDSDMAQYAAAYSEALRGALARRRRDPIAFSRDRFEQIKQVNSGGTWDHRAAEWAAACAVWRTPKP
jgi:glycosyltransferase involved in cell wall biosynthesis